MWNAYCRPYFCDKKGSEIFLDVRDHVPYLKSWPETIDVPARPVPTAPAAGRPALPESEALANKLASDRVTEIFLTADSMLAPLRNMLFATENPMDLAPRISMSRRRFSGEINMRKAVA